MQVKKAKSIGKVVWRSSLSIDGGFPFKYKVFKEVGGRYKLYSRYYELTVN